jgi:hypothetical protein
LFSQLITLYLTPVIYTYMAALSERKSKGKAAVEVVPPVAISR